MLRSAPRLRRGALLIRGPDRKHSHPAFVGPGSAEQRQRGAAPRPRHVAA